MPLMEHCVMVFIFRVKSKNHAKLIMELELFEVLCSLLLCTYVLILFQKYNRLCFTCCRNMTSNFLPVAEI